MDFDQLFALRTYYEEQNEYISDEIDIIKMIKTDLINNGMKNNEVNSILHDFYKSFGIILKADELKYIRPSTEGCHQFFNSSLNLNNTNIKKCNNPNCKKNKTENIDELKTNSLLNDDECSCENDTENDEECETEDEENDNETDDETKYDEEDENYKEANHNNIFYNFEMNLISEFLINNTQNEDIICTLDDIDKINLKRINLEHDSENKCNVCIDQMKKDEEVIILPCNHTFHANCIEEWLTKYNYKCPICKHEVGKPKYNI